MADQEIRTIVAVRERHQVGSECAVAAGSFSDIGERHERAGNPPARPRPEEDGERFETHAEARAALLDYLAFYNHRRRHSAVGYQSPTEHERRHSEQQAVRLAA